MPKLLLLWLFLGLSCLNPVLAQAPAAFTVIPLGVKGGLVESNLSAYLVAPAGSAAYACLDAGSLYTGVEKAVANRHLPAPAGEAIRTNIKAYLLSHAHLDHVAGLLLNAPDDAPKSIYGLAGCLNTVQNDYFNWRAWPNFGSGGPAPALRKYQLRELPLRQEVAVENTGLSVRAFALSHGKPYQSAAFLLRTNNSYLLYLGDTGADRVEQTIHLRELWQTVAPLLRAGQLRAVFIEASYPDSQPVSQLFGHLTPALLLEEMAALGSLAGKEALRNLPVVVTHLKPSPGHEEVIRRQLREANHLQLRLIFPEQGQLLTF
ncbi:MBL fold metallo-hydrolase [Hymenobacter metallicola]|uniref:3',5'-cyclic-nucleotide phosphodiesterase n=1 Tax=Hymenobacter metallicola TaxID=2563114 RepID=A0A4Z0Q0Y5_9BACT|nr:3',5'-cyclic-nucleotide phosphodiesterase [Hymenobacter metallicola]TGE23199.1 3',5'-cyclic-nucleotide phosphodiesterase [Hymenobacter metallicola]